MKSAKPIIAILLVLIAVGLLAVGVINWARIQAQADLSREARSAANLRYVYFYMAGSGVFSAAAALLCRLDASRFGGLSITKPAPDPRKRHIALLGQEIGSAAARGDTKTAQVLLDAISKIQAEGGAA